MMLILYRKQTTLVLMKFHRYLHGLLRARTVFIKKRPTRTWFVLNEPHPCLNLCSLMDFHKYIDTISPLCTFRGHRYRFLNYEVFLSLLIVLILATVQTLLKCSITLHFIWVFTVCQITRLEVFQNTKESNCYLVIARGGSAVAQW